MSPEFRQGERVLAVRRTCTECGKGAEGNHSWSDGSGDICDRCADADDAESTELDRERANARAWASLDAQDSRGQTGPYWAEVRAMADELKVRP